jgi:hypothetical protein
LQRIHRNPPDPELPGPARVPFTPAPLPAASHTGGPVPGFGHPPRPGGGRRNGRHGTISPEPLGILAENRTGSIFQTMKQSLLYPDTYIPRAVKRGMRAALNLHRDGTECQGRALPGSAPEDDHLILHQRNVAGSGGCLPVSLFTRRYEGWRNTGTFYYAGAGEYDGKAEKRAKR